MLYKALKKSMDTGFHRNFPPALGGGGSCLWWGKLPQNFRIFWNPLWLICAEYIKLTYQVRSILDYDIDIHPLPIEEQTYTALNMNYSVAGFQVHIIIKLNPERLKRTWQMLTIYISKWRCSLLKIWLILHGSLNMQIDMPLIKTLRNFCTR